MDMRYVVSALIGAFCLFAIFAAITTARHLSQREGASGTHRLNGFATVGPDLGKMSGASLIARWDDAATKLPP
jgi:hypothetical protein